jgi:hypothetical protein
MIILGREQRRVKIVIDGENIEQVPNFNYVGCKISTIEMIADLEENISNYNKLNGLKTFWNQHEERNKTKITLYSIKTSS